MRDRTTPDALRSWAEAVIAEHRIAVAGLLGVRPPIPGARIEIDPAGSQPAWTSGTTITLGANWFADHPDDEGCVLHELAHVYMQAPMYTEDTIWLIEGIGDYVRDVLGHDAPWTAPHHRPGMARAGYQTTAHFLLWLEARGPGTVEGFSRRLSAGTYDERVFGEIAGYPLADLIARYEAEQRGRR